MRTLVLGLGNPILTDDGVGIHVVREAACRMGEAGASDQLTFAEASVGGFRLLEVLAGHERALLVDAIVTPEGEPGDVYRLGVHDLRASLHSGSTHDLSLPGALALGRRLGMALPSDEHLAILAVEAGDVLTFGEGCTPPVGSAIPRAADMVIDWIANDRRD